MKQLLRCALLALPLMLMPVVSFAGCAATMKSCPCHAGTAAKENKCSCGCGCQGQAGCQCAAGKQCPTCKCK